MYQPPRDNHLVSVADLAIRWNLSQQRVWQITQKRTFPWPIRIEPPRTRLWFRGDIANWEAKHRPHVDHA